jgi:addiction module RelB/DinJ family antitoxin
MPTELSSFRIDKKIKKEAQILAREMGTNLSNIINMYLAQFVKERKIHFMDKSTQIPNSSKQDSHTRDSWKTHIPEPKPHVVEALKELAEKRQLLASKQDFGNQVKSEWIPTEDVYIFYGTKDEKKFFRIDNSFYEEIPEKYFFFYEFTKSEHQIIWIPNNLVLAIDDRVKKEELLSHFKIYIEANREALLVKHLFGYSRLILRDGDKQIFNAIRDFFEDQNNYILIKIQEVDEEPIILRIENHWILKEEFFSDKSDDSIRKSLLSDVMKAYWRYVIYKRDSWFNDGVSFEILTWKYISSESEKLDLFQKAKKDFNLEELNLVQK